MNHNWNINSNPDDRFTFDIIPPVSFRVWTPLFWGNPPPLSGYSLFLKQILKNSPSFWQPSKLVHANCMKHFKMKGLHFVHTKSTENIIIITLYTFRLNSVFTNGTLVRYCLSYFSYLICKRNEHETFLITILLNLICV